MTKQAERPVTIAFTSNYRQNDPEFTCTFDSNRFIEWEIQPLDMPIGEVIFRGEPIEDDGYTELARVKFDYCDNGLSLYQDLANMLYEAQHTWLDYTDALEKECLKVDEDYLTLSILSNGTHDYNIYNCEENILPVVWTVFKDKVESIPMDSGIVAFKPVKRFDFYRFNQVKVWQPPQ
jgi:hypothetical protein